jgi:toxin ParE1/3/4
MAYRVELTARADRNLRRLYRRIHAEESAQARVWFNGLERAVLSLDEHPGRRPETPETATLRHLLYGAKPDTYRIIFKTDERSHVVTVLHIRDGARKPLKAVNAREPKS